MVDVATCQRSDNRVPHQHHHPQAAGPSGHTGSNLYIAGYVSVCITASFACAWYLNSAASRREAAWVVPAALLWGAFAAAPAFVRDALPRPRLLWVGLAAVAVRLPLVDTPPVLSDDLFRYLWEGLVVHSGMDPYVTPPADLIGLDDSLRAQVNHPHLTTAYPPMAMLWFVGLHIAGGTAAVAQTATALVDAVLAMTIAAAVGQRGGPAWAGWLYAVHPLPVLASAAGAHIDVIAIALVAPALLLRPAGRSPLALLGASVKLLPALWAATWLGGVPARRAVLSCAAASGVAILLPIALGVPYPTDVPAGIQAYAGSWSFNGLVHPLVRPVLGEASRASLLVIGGLAVIGTTARRWHDPAAPWLVIATVFLMLSPTVHPWYVLWALVPSIVLGRRAWVVGATSMLAAYGVLATLQPDGSWIEPSWLPLCTWAPALMALWLERPRRAAGPQ